MASELESSSESPSESLAPATLPTYLYKIIPSSSAPPTPLPLILPLSPLDAQDGYIHLSTSLQTPGTADRYFRSDSDTQIYIAKIPYDAEGVRGSVKWEQAGAGVFAHLYNGGRLGREEILEVRLWERSEGESWSAVFEKEGTWLSY